MSSHLKRALDHWELLTLKGDELFYCGRFPKAANQFYQSVNFIESYLSLPDHHLPDLLRCFVVGCHNLAACYLRLANDKEVEYYYHYPMRTLQQLHEDAPEACRYQRARLIELDYARNKYMNYLVQCKRRQNLHFIQVQRMTDNKPTMLQRLTPGYSLRAT